MNALKDMKVGTKLIAGFLAVAVIGAIIGVLGIVKTSELRTCSWSRMKVLGMRFGMGCEAQTTAIAWLLRGFATTQTARSRAHTPMRRS